MKMMTQVRLVQLKISMKLKEKRYRPIQTKSIFKTNPLWKAHKQLQVRWIKYSNMLRKMENSLTSSSKSHSKIKRKPRWNLLLSPKRRLTSSL